jgi:hypothetical protein
VLADDALAWQLMEGGWLDRRGVGAMAFGALPLRVVQRQVSRQSLRAAREAVQQGWESELVNLLESSAMRAARAPEEHVVLVRELPLPAERGEGPSSAQARGGPPPSASGITELLAALREHDATDLTLTVGLPPTLHGAFGSRALGDARCAARACTPWPPGGWAASASRSPPSAPSAPRPSAPCPAPRRRSTRWASRRWCRARCSS